MNNIGIASKKKLLTYIFLPSIMYGFEMDLKVSQYKVKIRRIGVFINNDFILNFELLEI